MTSPWLRVVDGLSGMNPITGDLLKTEADCDSMSPFFDEARDFSWCHASVETIQCRILEDRAYLSHFVSIILEG